MNVLVRCGVRVCDRIVADGALCPVVSQDDSGTRVLIFFGILFLTTWAGGIWVTPFGPILFDVPWLSFLLVGLFIALILTAISPPPRRPRTAQEAAAYAEAEAAIAIDIFFWVLIAGLIVTILVAYL
jgi:hypothetical protein